GPGHWNDPDMLVVGQVGWGKGLRDSRLTADEQYSHVSLWALLSAPLLIGCDLASLDKFTLNLLCNNEVISVNQDPLGNQAKCLWDQDGLQVWGKQLADGSFAAGIFNHGAASVDVKVKDVLAKAGWTNVDSCRDLWRQKACPESVCVQSHGVIMVKFNANK
ncbi:MAG: alpha-galactosidase, partial [Bacteroidales bacterium]|nr:alpha-galactosidase [Bacteroidales bacterium]